MKIKAWCVWDKRSKNIFVIVKDKDEALRLSSFGESHFIVKPCTVEVDDGKS